MNKSEQINELATALAKSQAEMQNALKDKSGYGYKYVDLAAILDIARPLLTKNGLSVTQLCSATDHTVTVETMLMHSSGQWISEIMSMPKLESSKNLSGPQLIGMSITYARRYSLAAIVGIAQADDDASLRDAKAELAEFMINDEVRYRKMKDWMEKKGIKSWTGVSSEQALKMVEAIKRGE